jgi:hypothetical protein
MSGTLVKMPVPGKDFIPPPNKAGIIEWEG